MWVLFMRKQNLVSWLIEAINTETSRLMTTVPWQSCNANESNFMILLLTVVGFLCIVLLSCMYLCFLPCILLLCVYCCPRDLICQIAGQKPVSGSSCDQPPRHRFFLVSLCLKANAEMIPKNPSCYCMLLM